MRPPRPPWIRACYHYGSERGGGGGRAHAGSAPPPLNPRLVRFESIYKSVKSRNLVSVVTVVLTWGITTDSHLKTIVGRRRCRSSDVVLLPVSHFYKQFQCSCIQLYVYITFIPLI